jgi:hypothetical protein
MPHLILPLILCIIKFNYAICTPSNIIFVFIGVTFSSLPASQLVQVQIMTKFSLLTITGLLAAITGFAQSTPQDSTAKTINDTILPFQSQDLKEVKVVAKKKMIEQKIDRMVVNVDAMISNSGTTALEVLEKTPGVQVDKDGNISLKGKQGVTVMLDGRPTYLSGEELANLLRGMESSQLEQIEVMTNPPARFDAAGNSGVINIKTKKNKNQGVNGSITVGATQGRYFRTNESLSLNYRTGKVNLFSNYSFSRGDGFHQLEIFRRYTDKEGGNTRAIFEQVAFMRNKRTNNNLKLGMDYYLNKKTTLGIVFSGFANPERNKGVNTSFLKSPSSVTDSIVESTSNMREVWKNAGVNLNLRHIYDTTGRELTADIDVIAYDITNEQEITNTSFTPEMVKKFDDKLLGNLPMNINIYSAKMDYVHPLKNQMKIEAGWKSSYVITDSKANYFNVSGNEATPDYGKTNFFRYRENINAAYINVNKKLSKKVDIQTGLRFENTNYWGLQHGNPTRRDSSFTNTYNSLFPTVFVGYAADKNNQFGFSVGRRIDRPRYEDLNPFMYFIDRYTYGRGNPYLRPQYTNNIEISHTLKGFLTTTLNYSFTKNLIAETFDQEGEYATIQSNGNYGKRNNAGIAVSAQVPVAKWLNSNIYTNYSYNKLEGRLFGEDVEIDGATFLASVNNQFNFQKGWSGEISGWYRTKGIEGQIITYPMGALTAGVGKQVIKGKGTVKLTVRDIFYSQPPRGDINFKTTEAKFRASWDSRQANLTFTYRFGKPVKSNAPPRRERQNEEQNRVGGKE